MLLNAYSTRRSVIRPEFTDDLEFRTRWVDDQLNLELMAHLDGFQGWVWQSAGEQMTAQVYALLQHISHVQTNYAFEVDETDAGALEALGRWATETNSILFTQLSQVVDPDGNPLLPPAPGQPAPGRVPVLADAVERAERIRQWLAGQGVRVTPSLPPVRAADEIVPRTAEEVALRALGLALSAEYALIEGHPADVPGYMRDVLPRAFAALSPAEQAFFANPDDQTAAPMSWRWEAVKELLWALGRIELDWPNTPADVDALRAASIERAEDEFMSGAQLRSLGELLDEAERNRALLWALREHRHFDGPPAGDASIDIVAERQEAINWLLDRATEWDDVDTPT